MLTCVRKATLSSIFLLNLLDEQLPHSFHMHCCKCLDQIYSKQIQLSGAIGNISTPLPSAEISSPVWKFFPNRSLYPTGDVKPLTLLSLHFKGAYIHPNYKSMARQLQGLFQKIQKDQLPDYPLKQYRCHYHH